MREILEGLPYDSEPYAACQIQAGVIFAYFLGRESSVSSGK